MLDDAIEHLVCRIETEEPSDQDESFAVDMPRSSQFFTAQKAKSSCMHCHEPSTFQNSAAGLVAPTRYSPELLSAL